MKVPRQSAQLGGEKKALVDTGVSYSKEKIVGGLKERGIDPGDISYLLLTHIHMDHAGAAGYLIEELPEARVVVHKAGAKHLIDPSRLIRSVKEATGERFENYGSMKPVPEDKVVEVSERKKIKLGEKEIVAFPTPGHAPHHLSFYDSSAEAMFSGDSAGINLDGDLYPTTPPPSFDLEKSLESLEVMNSFDPNYLLYAHYGSYEGAQEKLKAYKKFLKDWVDYVERKLADNTLEEAQEIVAEDYSDRLNDKFNETELKMNVEGVSLYLNS